jgi:hypothetical protein
MIWTTAAPAVTTAFLSSLVEAIEALTIVLAVASVRGWRPAGSGAFAGLVLLVLIVLALGPTSGSDSAAPAAARHRDPVTTVRHALVAQGDTARGYCTPR